MLKCLKKNELATRSGAGSSKVAYCKCYAQLMFLHDTISNRPTDSNLTSIVTDPTPEVILPSSSRSPSLSSPRSTLSSPPQSKKNKVDNVEMALIDALKGAPPQPTPTVQEDSDLLFCKSIVPQLRKMEAKKNRMAKIEIQQVLLKYEFDN